MEYVGMKHGGMEYVGHGDMESGSMGMKLRVYNMGYGNL